MIAIYYFEKRFIKNLKDNFAMLVKYYTNIPEIRDRILSSFLLIQKFYMLSMAQIYILRALNIVIDRNLKAIPYMLLRFQT